MSRIKGKNVFNNLFMHMETLRPITNWLMPQKFKDLVDNIYNEHRSMKNIKCFICNKTFANTFIRDFHLNTTHEFSIHYTCIDCQNIDNSEEDEIYFNSPYAYHVHRIEEHNEKGYGIAFII